MFYQIPPAGNPICLSTGAQPAVPLEEFFSPYQAKYYASGTAALAAVITAAKQLKPVADPEVILPAYGCPDLVSAANFAGAKPVLVDLEPDRPWISLEKLSACISSRTVAIIAASLFGISERIAELRPIADQAGVLLIEDSAQAFPLGQARGFWQADFVVLSFGRGKPVSLLGGGAVLYRKPWESELLPDGIHMEARGGGERVLYRAKARLYNMMISPWLYWLPQSLPFLHLGETRYHRLAEIDALDRTRLEMLAINIAAYQQASLDVQRALSSMLGSLRSAGSGVKDLPGLCQVSRNHRLLRYPLLVDAGVRDTLCRRLKHAGLGPSIMYPASLPGIPGLEQLMAGQGTFPMAETFAASILTLPTHSHVRKSDIANMQKLLDSV